VSAILMETETEWNEEFIGLEKEKDENDKVFKYFKKKKKLDLKNPKITRMKKINSSPSLVANSQTGDSPKPDIILKKEHSMSLGDLTAGTLPLKPQKIISIWKEFKEFSIQGSVTDMAVGIIVGGAFRKIVNSLVNDIIMPPIGWLLSGVDFANLFILLKRGKKGGSYKSLGQAKEDGAVTVNVGNFLNSFINFVVISVVIFTMVRIVNTMRKKKAKITKNCPLCYSKIDQRSVRCSFCTADLSEDEETDSHSS